MTPYTPAFWRPIGERLIVAEFHGRPDVNFSMKWLEIESGGWPGAIGAPGQLGPDGNPAEIGLGQLYNPDDFRAEGIDPAAFRAYCVGDTQHLSRDLTPDECDDQVRYTLLAKIQQSMAKADELVGVPRAWSAPDYYKLVKAPHALPAILGRGWPAVCVKLGRRPADWAEFRATLGMDHNDQWKRALDACEACGGAVQG